MIAVVTVLLYSVGQKGADIRTAGEFYAKTLHALDHQSKSGSAETEDKQEISRAMSARLQEAAQLAKDKANAKAPKPDPPSQLVGVGSAAEGARDEKSVAGRKKFRPAGAETPAKKESEEDHEAEVELNSILKKSPSKPNLPLHIRLAARTRTNGSSLPVIIFSKSYCPHSKRAKGILVDKYLIDPPPFVVELDLHPIGRQLQDLLKESTGRSTVPNVLINGVSVGGGDEIGALDAKQTLIETVKDLGGKKILGVRQRAKEDEKDHGLR